jgi:anti-sigma regulatory factor (Ser/Thr protein kinase)
MKTHFRLPPDMNAIAMAGERLRTLLVQAAADGALSDPRSGDDMALVLAELISNIVRHGGPCRDIRVGLLVSRDQLVATVADNAAPFDMTALPAQLPEDLLAESGRGLWLIRQCLDDFKYRRTACNFHRCYRLTRKEAPQ